MTSLLPLFQGFNNSLSEFIFALETKEGFETLLLRYGYDLSIEDSLWNELNKLEELKIGIEKVSTLLGSSLEQNNEEVNIESALAILEQIKIVVQAILSLDQGLSVSIAPFNSDTFWREIAESFLIDLFVRTLVVCQVLNAG